MKRIRMLLLVLAGVCGPAMAAYAPGTLITPNPLQPTQQLLVLEHSLVDLVHGIEILNFNYTQGKSVCDVYKGLAGQTLNKSSCFETKTVYTDAAVTAIDGWRVGSSRNLLDVVEMFYGWTKPASWLTKFVNNRDPADVFANSLGATRSMYGAPSFNVATSDGFENSGDRYELLIDEINDPSGSDTGFRQSYGSSFATIHAEKSVLMVREWTGEARAINSANAVPGVSAGLFGIGMAWLLCRRKKGTS